MNIEYFQKNENHKFFHLCWRIIFIRHGSRLYHATSRKQFPLGEQLRLIYFMHHQIRVGMESRRV